MAMTLNIVRAIDSANTELNRIFGSDHSDYLYDIAENAVADWTDGDGNVDEEMVIQTIENTSDSYIDFMKDNYPENFIRE